ncbi:hypothetical protein NDU88_008361 [Pleurodeles waltl]|uniref:Uncharacterized protein n=1 Tax=Pleurodeles waltl TaxID=8319 RepID=A0AAV7N4R2_PLEWA|nr:hypothetical protein NDU88_008361 [Pleurodeles waltl]
MFSPPVASHLLLSGLFTGQPRRAPRPRVSPLCAAPQPGDIRLRLPSRRPTRHRQAPPPVVPVRTTPSGWARIQGQRRAQRTAQTRGRGRNSAATHAGPGPHQGARARRRPPPGPQPPSSGPGHAGPSPAALQHGDPSGTARLGHARRPGRSLSAAPGSPSHSGARSRGGRDCTSAVPPSTAVVPLHSGHRTAHISASRHRFKVGPSGADQLSSLFHFHSRDSPSPAPGAEVTSVGVLRASGAQSVFPTEVVSLLSALPGCRLRARGQTLEHCDIAASHGRIWKMTTLCGEVLDEH